MQWRGADTEMLVLCGMSPLILCGGVLIPGLRCLCFCAFVACVLLRSTSLALGKGVPSNEAQMTPRGTRCSTRAEALQLHGWGGLNDTAHHLQDTEHPGEHAPYQQVTATMSEDPDPSSTDTGSTGPTSRSEPANAS